MWIFLNDSFLSIVKHRDIPGHLLVRARRPGDIKRAFPWVEEEETPNADYRYRAAIEAREAADCIARAMREIPYDNFKNSIQDPQYHNACSDVWLTMLGLQKGGKYKEMPFMPENDLPRQ